MFQVTGSSLGLDMFQVTVVWVWFVSGDGQQSGSGDAVLHPQQDGAPRGSCVTSDVDVTVDESCDVSGHGSYGEDCGTQRSDGHDRF